MIMKVVWLLAVTLVSARKLTRKESNYVNLTCGFPMISAAVPKFIIQGGRQVLPDQYPFAVEFVNKYTPTNDPYCSGVLISSRHILTAAHCLYELGRDENRWRICKEEKDSIAAHHRVVRQMHKPDAFFIYVGSSCPQKGRCASKRTVYRAVSLTPHKDFNACDISDDIALVELTQDVSSSEAMPICLPRANERLSEPTALGYGFDPDARIKRNPGLQVAKFRQYGMEGPNIFTRDPVTAICAGDSGGPLFGYREGRYVLYGLSSFGSDCGENRMSAIGQEYEKKRDMSENYYVDVRRYIDWICKKTGVCEKQEYEEEPQWEFRK